MFGDEVIALPDLVEQARVAGWRVLHLSTADQREWDDFEGTWRAGRQQWLLDHPTDARAEEVRNTLDAQQREYVETYRGVLGFCYLVLARERPPATSVDASMQEWVHRTRRDSAPVGRLEVPAALDEHRGPWPDAGR